MTVQTDKRPAAIRVVIPFVFRHWLQQPGRAAIVAGGLLGATAADLFMPIFSGRLVDALTSGASDAAARHAAFVAFGRDKWIRQSAEHLGRVMQIEEGGTDAVFSHWADAVSDDEPARFGLDG